MVAGSDLVVGTSLAFGLATVADRLGIPYRYIAFTPQLLPSARHPFMTFKHQGFPEWWNRLTWRMVSAADRINLTRMINDRRRAWGLSPIPDAWPHILSPRVMVAADAEIYPLPPDRETDAAQTGYLHLDQPDVRLPALEAFLDKGPAPVYAGFGSMPRRDQARKVSLLVRAARVAGRRVIIGRFWKGTTPFDRADDVFFLKGYPHLRLFPRMAAVVHHGGAGTTATAAVSGVPQVIVPHILDQYGWADRVWRSGLGPRPVWRSRLTWRRLARALDEALGRESFKEAAAETARGIDRETSLARAVRELSGG
jgi:UDP:flavonoid glycosyltransferase YjiC (YdhE family)